MANSDYRECPLPWSFAPIASLAEGVDYLDHKLILGAANFPRTDSLHVGMAALVDEEFMVVTEVGQGSVTVSRGCADTVPAQHAAGSLIWFVELNVMGSDAVEHVAGEVESVKYSPFTTDGKLAVADSTIDVVRYNYRFVRPYPPGAVRVQGDRWWVEHTVSADSGPLVFTWNYRDRIIEADQLVDHDAADIGPEPGTTYTMRVYDANNVLRATYSDIMKDSTDIYGKRVAASWSYSWDRAMADLNAHTSEIGVLVPGKLTLFATRDGFDSWQGYTIPFNVDTQGYFIKAAQLAQITAQGDDIGSDYPPPSGIFAGQLAHITAQGDIMADSGPVHGVFVASLREGVGQATNFYTPLDRGLFEAPYALLTKRGDDASKAKLVTVVARPSDRLTDAHSIWSRYDWPRGSGWLRTFEHRVDPEFTPWLTLGAQLDYLDTNLVIGNTSFTDGVPLSNVRVGQVALVDTEIIRIDALGSDSYTIARGCYDTVPTKHYSGARVWFFDAAAGNDPTAYPYTWGTYTLDRVKVTELGNAAEVKMVPAVYGPPLDINTVPSDQLVMAHRVERPYAPGEVLVNGLPWFKGCIVAPNQDTRITWVHRNRDTQGAQAVDHHAPTRVPEAGQKYRLSITLSFYDYTAKVSRKVTVRNQTVDGESFLYTYAMAQADGYRSGTLLKICGHVTVGLVLEAIRDGFASWQNYVIPISLPAPACPPGRPPGGGQLPPGNGGGNGTPGGSDNPPPPGGNGPPPPDVPPDWPDPIDPPPVPDPEDPNPELAHHWDLNWDRHWDAYTKDNTGD
jgi:hypothetical protein